MIPGDDRPSLNVGRRLGMVWRTTPEASEALGLDRFFSWSLPVASRRKFLGFLSKVENYKNLMEA